MNPYRYDSLPHDPEAHFIRILTLNPGSEAEELRGSLETCRLVDAPQYEALSYCWGTDKQDAVIYCSENSAEITKTLESALRVLRRPNEERRLWIDQICINQKDDEERSQQVSLMRQIYTEAERTIVWLGSDEQKQAPALEGLFRALRDLGVVCRPTGYLETQTVTSRYTFEFIDFAGYAYSMDAEDDAMIVNNESICFPADQILVARGLPPRSSEAWPAFTSLLGSRYFTRVWTLQEVLSSREAVVLWGETEYAWSSIREAYRWAELNHCMVPDPRHSSSGSLRYVNFLNIELQWYRGIRFHKLADLVAAGRGGFEATDRRDQIYAFVSLASDGARFKIDYSKTEKEVFIDFTNYSIRNNDLTMLNGAALCADGSCCLPSWVLSGRPIRPNLHLLNDQFDCMQKPLYSLAGRFKSDSDWLAYIELKDEDFSAAGCTSVRLKETDKPGHLYIQGFRFDQANIVCTSLAYSSSKRECGTVVAQYDELFGDCKSPALLSAMICCLVANEKPSSSNHDELLVHFINACFQSMIQSAYVDNNPPVLKHTKGLELIRLASEAMNSDAPTRHQELSQPVQEFIRSSIPQFFRGWLSQEHVDKVIDDVSRYWRPKYPYSNYGGARARTGIGRRLFVTTRGHVGIGPARMSISDVIIIAWGGKTPFVLRPVPKSDEYVLLGDCYIHGFMYGEATEATDRPTDEWFCLSDKTDVVEEVGVHDV